MPREEIPTCSICANTLTQEKRKLTKCPGCDIQACRECVRKYLTGESMVDDPHCMNCRIAWTQSVVHDAVGKTYVTKEMVLHRRQILLNRQRANIPLVQEYAIAKRDVGKLENQLRIKQSKFRQLQRQQMREWENENRAECEEIFRLHRILDPQYSRRMLPFHIDGARQQHAGEGARVPERAKFTHKCSIENCEGFLSSAWKCGVCENYTCSQCGKECGRRPWNAEDTEHRCVPDEVETFTLVKNECKPCPQCATQIFKIAGCDQMWCTQCQTPFSWRTGLRINGTVHNPHYFEWARRQGGGQMHRQPGDIICGRDGVSIQHLNAVMNQAFLLPLHLTQGGNMHYLVKPNQYSFLEWLIMRRNHHHDQELRTLRRWVDEDNRTQTERDLLADFIVHQIDEETYGGILSKHDKKRRFNVEFIAIMETFCTVIQDLMIKIIEIPQNVTATLAELGNVDPRTDHRRSIITGPIIELEIAKIMVEMESFCTYLIEQLNSLANVYKLSPAVLLADVEYIKESIKWIFNNWKADFKLMVNGEHAVSDSKARTSRFVVCNVETTQRIHKYIMRTMTQDPWCWSTEDSPATSDRPRLVKWPPFDNTDYYSRIGTSRRGDPNNPIPGMRHTRGWRTIDGVLTRHRRYNQRY